MNFHPDQNMPGCMLPDGGNACLGYATLRDEWNRQRWRIEALEALEQGYDVAREVFTERVEALEAALSAKTSDGQHVAGGMQMSATDGANSRCPAHPMGTIPGGPIGPSEDSTQTPAEAIRERDAEIDQLRALAARAERSFEIIRGKLIDNLTEPERSAFWEAVAARDAIRHILTTRAARATLEPEDI